jgi:hypothetical protein
VAHDFRADLDELLLQARHRPIFDRLWRRQRPQEIAEVVGERKYTAGKRRLSIYWTWSYPWEPQRDPAAMENRFSTMTEVRTVLWPAYETPEWSAAQFLQGSPVRWSFFTVPRSASSK